MLNVIEEKRSKIEYCAEYLKEALLNHSNVSLIHKKYIEDSIARSMKRELNKRAMNNSANPSEQLNKQFHSPTNSEEGVVVGLNKKKKKMDFDLNYDDFGLDDVDRQVVKSPREDLIQEGESFEF